ncbi:hypothetical protein C8F04DRAFT_1299276 [Mycena alexandri]|uniref:Uncharacterized protein n=1 Tax=Mycena alexandri TaxID=1745969 RepID=A0AAD6T9B7_9AGAR|nr:hypothetical protein C8F04DRAFT_1299276 [Mycena alexandri]
MPRQPTTPDIHLNNISKCLDITRSSLQLIVDSLEISGLEAILNTTQSLLKLAEKIKQNKFSCSELMQQAHQVLMEIVGLYVKSDTGGELVPNVLNHIANFTQTLHKIHTFVEAQQSGNKVKMFFRQGEMGTLLKDCKAELQQGLDFFQITNIIAEVKEMQELAQARHQEVLDIIETLSSSDSASSISSNSYASSTSISMLPAEPKIFHGRENELEDILKLFKEESPRVAVLGLKPGKDLTQGVLRYLSGAPPTLLVLDNLETVWDPAESRDAAQKMFLDIADDGHSIEEVNQILALTDNMPLVISLLAHLVDTEGCFRILSRWETEKTALLSEGYDKRSNLEVSISLSLSSSRMTSMPNSQDLLSLLSILPDGLSDVELKQTKFPVKDILGCKAALLHTALAYTDDHKRLKALVPTREYMLLPATDQMIRPLFKHFQELLELYSGHAGKASGMLSISQIGSNFSNIQNILQNTLRHKHPDLVASIYCACYLRQFSQITHSGDISLFHQIISMLAQICDRKLEVYVIIETLKTWPVNHPNHPDGIETRSTEYCNYFEDPNLKCMLFVECHYSSQGQNSVAMKHGQAALSLAQSAGNNEKQCDVFIQLAFIKCAGGDYTAGQVYAKEAHRLASLRITGNFVLGNGLKIILGEVQSCKSEYVEAHSMHNQAAQAAINDPFQYGIASINMADTEVSMGTAKHEIQKKIDLAQTTFKVIGNDILSTLCDAVQADLNLREGDILRASWGNDSEAVSYCLERLGDGRRWTNDHYESSWSTVLLAHSVKQKEKLGIHKGLQFMGDVFLQENDEVTATSLFTLALQGFTLMDVHRSRAECMIRLGDISERNRDVLNALELWDMARPLFERSSQTKQIQAVDERMARVNNNVKEQHQKNLAHLVELSVPVGKADEEDEEDSEVEL